MLQQQVVQAVHQNVVFQQTITVAQRVVVLDNM
jgi:hypothetical protein